MMDREPGNTSLFEAAVFDIDGTLLVGRRPASEAAMDGLRAAHAVLVAAGAQLPDFRTTFALVQREMTRAAASMSFGNFRETSLPGIVSGFVSRAFPDTPLEAVEEALDAWYAPLGESARAAPDAAEALAALKARGFRIAAAGNSAFGSKYVRRDLEREGLLPFLESVTCSADVGFRKPNLFLLSRALESLGAPPGRTIHVGDDPREDVEAPQEAGMIAVLLGVPGASTRADLVVPGLGLLSEAINRLSSRRDLL